MKAIVRSKPGPPELLQLREIEKPFPQDHEVLVKVVAATVTAGDVITRRLRFPLTLLLRVMGMPAKEIPGHEFAGEIEAVGAAVTRFKAGDQVFGTTTGLKVGANAEYICLPEAWSKGVLALKPANISYAEAAAVPVGGMTAYHILQKADIQPGQSVLVYGASGSVGSYALQLAKAYGAQVTAVCSGRNAGMVNALGADRVIDYTQEQFTQSGETYDVIFDAVGKISAKQSAPVLKENGVFLSIRSSTSEKTEYLQTLTELITAGKLRAFIDRRYPLAETAEAHRYVETGRKRGNVVIIVVEGEENRSL